MKENSFKHNGKAYIREEIADGSCDGCVLFDKDKENSCNYTNEFPHLCTEDGPRKNYIFKEFNEQTNHNRSRPPSKIATAQAKPETEQRLEQEFFMFSAFDTGRANGS
jgi:hypothetical protein